MKISAVAKPFQQLTRPMSKPKKAILSAVAATALALTPMTTLNAQETGKEKIENAEAKKTNAFMIAYCALFGMVSAALIGLTIYNYRFTKDLIEQKQAKAGQTQPDNNGNS